MADNLLEPLLIVNTEARVAGQNSPAMSQSITGSYAAGQTLNQTLVLRAGQQYSPHIGFSNLVINTTGPVQLLAARGANPSFINQTITQQTTIDDSADSFTLTNNGTTSVTVKMLVLVAAAAPLAPVGVVTSLDGMIGDLNIVAGAGISVTNTAQTITIANTGPVSVNGQTGVVTINANNLLGLATVAKTGSYSDLIGAPDPYTLPIATASVLGGIKVGSGLSITGDGTLSVTPQSGLVTSVNTLHGDVVVQATDNGASGSQSLISNSGATTGDIILNRLAVAGSGLAISTTNGVTTITSSGLQGAVTSVDGQHPDSNGNVVVQAVDNTGTGTSLISSSGATTGNLTFKKLVAGSNIGLSADVNGNVVIAGTVNPYTLPVATTTVLGGVKQGANVTIAGDGTISVAAPYALTAATSSVLGGVKVGANINVAGDGTISVAAPYVLPVATTTVLGGVKQGANVNIAVDGTISVATPYALPIASASLLGGIKVGANLTIAGDGTLSAGAPYSLPAASDLVRGGVKVGSGLAITGDVLSVVPYSLPVATPTVLGGVKQGNGVSIAADGTISVASSYVLPIASSSVLGGVKIGANVNIAGDGTISVAAPYVLPQATANSLGGVKVGANINLDQDGTIWVNPPPSIVPATATVLGSVKIGANVNVLPDGTISVAAPYSLPTASATVLGGIKVGANLSIDGSGVLSATSAYVLPKTTTSTLGGLIVGDNLTVDANGRVSAGAPYALPIASSSVLGGVKIGSGIAVAGDGTISVTASAPVTSVSGQTGAVVVKAQSANPQAGTQSLIVNSGATTGTITTRDLVAGTGVTIAADGNGNLVVSSTGLVSSVSGQTGAVVVRAIDNNSTTGLSLISDSGSTTGTIKLLRLVAGSNVTLGPDGSGNIQIDSSNSYTLPIATGSVLGGVKIGANVSVAGDGTISVAAPYSLPIASASVLGGIKVGTGLTIAGDGTLSASGTAGVSSLNGLTGAVTVSTTDLSSASGVTLISDTGAANGNVKLLRLVAGSNIALSNDVNGNVQIDGTSSGGVTSVSGQTGVVVVSAQDNNAATGATLISSSGSTTGTIKLKTIVAGSNVTLGADGNGNLQINAAASAVTSVSTQTGAVVVQATDNNTGSGTSIIVDSGSTTANIKVRRIVAGAGVTLSTDGNNNLVITASPSYYDIPGGIAGVMTASQLLGQYVAVRAITFPANFVGSAGFARTSATASTTVTVQKVHSGSTTTLGTIVYAASGTIPTFTTTGGAAQSLAAGDALQFVAPASPDSTLADATFTLFGTAA